MRNAELRGVVEAIDGQHVVNDLLELATIGGERLDPTPDHPVHIATNRLALTEKDLEARETFVKPRMQAAGMNVLDDHPLALIGIYPGRYPGLAPIVIMSHTDTVPGGDIYDGALGVVGGLHLVSTLHDRSLQTDRNVIVASLSCEESPRFGMATIGSRALFHGLSSEEFALRKNGDQSLAEALGSDGVRWASQPVFGPRGNDLPQPHALIELHVEQHTKLIEQGLDIGVVDRIAAPVRYRSAIGETPLQPDTRTYQHERYFQLNVAGIADHSGATPMGPENRADGLLETVTFLDSLLEKVDRKQTLAIGAIEVEEGAMNKVPGLTKTMLRITADSEQAIEETQKQLQAAFERHQAFRADSPDRFGINPLRLEQIHKNDAGVFFSAEAMLARHRAAFYFIKAVNRAANGYAAEGVVGTVPTLYTSARGQLTLEVDIRGIDLESRNLTVQQIQRDIAVRNRNGSNINLGEALAGSGGSPVALDPGLVRRASEVITAHSLGNTSTLFSAAVHDTQNAALAHIPSVMLFCQSKDGIAHNPDAYTDPANIEKGVRALAALTIDLADETP